LIESNGDRVQDIKDLLVVVEQNVEKPIPLFVYRNGEGIKELALVPLLHQGRPTLGLVQPLISPLYSRITLALVLAAAKSSLSRSRNKFVL